MPLSGSECVAQHIRDALSRNIIFCLRKSAAPACQDAAAAASAARWHRWQHTVAIFPMLPNVGFVCVPLHKANIADEKNGSKISHGIALAEEKFAWLMLMPTIRNCQYLGMRGTVCIFSRCRCLLFIHHTVEITQRNKQRSVRANVQTMPFFCCGELLLLRSSTLSSSTSMSAAQTFRQVNASNKRCWTQWTA